MALLMAPSIASGLHIYTRPAASTRWTGSRLEFDGSTRRLLEQEHVDGVIEGPVRRRRAQELPPEAAARRLGKRASSPAAQRRADDVEDLLKLEKTTRGRPPASAAIALGTRPF